MKKLIEAFNQAINDSNLSKQEIAWSLMVEVDELEKILIEERQLNNPQELEVYRFIFKTNYKKRQAEGDGNI